MMTIKKFIIKKYRDLSPILAYYLIAALAHVRET